MFTVAYAERPTGICGCTIITPAMAAGVSDRLWEMGEVVKLLEDFEAKRIETQKLAALAPPGA